MTEQPEPLPQDPGPRTGKMRRLSTLKPADYAARRVKVLQTTNAMDERERAEWLEAAQWMTAYHAGTDGVTQADAYREQFRVEAKVLLRQDKPFYEFPKSRTATAYGVMRHSVEIMHEAPDKNDRPLWAHGLAEYSRWWGPIAHDFEAIARTFSALRYFGDDHDNPTSRELLARGETICGWLLTRNDPNRARPPHAVAIPYLPRWSIEPAHIDRWWWGDWRQTSGNVCGWWSSWHRDAVRMVPAKATREMF